MDNAMVKRGIGAVVLAIIAALLLGYLLKDKSREREEAVEMKLPGAPELTIPSLTEAVSDTATSAKEGAVEIVEDTKDAVKNAGSSVVASASGAMNSISDTATNAVEKTTDAAKSLVDNGSQSGMSNNANPGFSFRPPSQNEEKEINDNTNTNSINNSATVDNSKPQEENNNAVVASSNKPVVEEKPFKPVIEETAPKKKVVKKPAKPKPAAKPKAPAKPAVASSGKGKYSIQLLATSSQSRANKLAETMNSEGYLAFITQTQRDNKILYRVRVGGHGDRSAAIKAQDGMKRRYQKNFFVQNSLVVSN